MRNGEPDYKRFLVEHDLLLDASQQNLHEIIEEKVKSPIVGKKEDKRVNNTRQGDNTIAKLERKQLAVEHLLPQLSEQVELSGYQNISLEGLFVFLNTVSSNSYDCWEDKEPLLGVSIWILDNILKNNKYKELEVIFQKLEPGAGVSIDNFAIEDCVHSKKYIEKTIYILKQRNKDISSDCGRWIDEIAATGKVENTAGSRKLFKDLLNLCNKKDIETAIENYRKTYLEIIKQCFIYIKPELEDYDKKMSNAKQAFSQYKFMKQANSSKPEQKRLPNDELPKIVTSTYAEAVFASNLIQRKDIRHYTHEMITTLEDAARSVASIAEVVHRFSFGWALNPEDHAWYERIDLKEYQKTPIANPYELLFATFYLIEEDDDMVWCNFPGHTLFTLAVNSVPWSDMQTSKEKTCTKPQETNPFDFVYKATAEGEVRGIYNAVHLLAKSMHIIPAREIKIPQYIYDDFNAYNIDKTQRALLMNMSSTLYQYAMKKIPGEALASDEQKAESNKMIKQLKSENDLLKTQLHKEGKATAQKEAETERLKEEIEALKHELTELRNALYDVSEAPEEIVENNDITYPYEFDKKIIVYGGHDSFLASMRRLTKGNISIIDPDRKIDLTAVRNADLVAFQANCISHSYYYRIIDVIKKNKVPFMFLTKSSPKLCVEQLIEKLVQTKEA